MVYIQCKCSKSSITIKSSAYSCQFTRPLPTLMHGLIFRYLLIQVIQTCLDLQYAFTRFQDRFCRLYTLRNIMPCVELLNTELRRKWLRLPRVENAATSRNVKSAKLVTLIPGIYRALTLTAADVSRSAARTNRMETRLHVLCVRKVSLLRMAERRNYPGISS